MNVGDGIYRGMRAIPLLLAWPLALADHGHAAHVSVAYAIAPASRLEVATGKAGLLGFAGHAHLIRARTFSGRLLRDPDDPAQSSVQITIQTAGLEVLTPPDTEEIRQVTESMRRDVLAVERYPEITFVSRRVSAIDGGLHIEGALTIVGHTVLVPVDVRVRVQGDTLFADAGFTVNQTAFGIKPYRGGPGGVVRVADRVKFDIAIVALRVTE
jgi:polyisoprenoid-binding protein YceI